MNAASHKNKEGKRENLFMLRLQIGLRKSKKLCLRQKKHPKDVF